MKVPDSQSGSFAKSVVQQFLKSGHLGSNPFPTYDCDDAGPAALLL